MNDYNNNYFFTQKFNMFTIYKGKTRVDSEKIIQFSRKFYKSKVDLFFYENELLSVCSFHLHNNRKGLAKLLTSPIIESDNCIFHDKKMNLKVQSFSPYIILNSKNETITIDYKTPNLITGEYAAHSKELGSPIIYLRNGFYSFRENLESKFGFGKIFLGSCTNSSNIVKYHIDNMDIIILLLSTFISIFPLNISSAEFH